MESSAIQLLIDDINDKIAKLGVKLDQIHQKQESLMIDERSLIESQVKFESKKLQSGLENSKVKKLKKEYEAAERGYQVKIDKLETDQKKLMSDLYAVCERYKDVQEIVLDKELVQWKKGQTYFGISESNELKKIKNWCKDLADIICNIKRLAKQLKNLMPSNHMKLLLLKISSLLQNLVAGTFIIEQESFIEKEDLHWGQIGETLSRMWNLACGRPLSENNIYYLACKAFQTENLDPSNLEEKHLSWTKFGKEVLIGHNFTFWEWFQSMLTLTQHHMQDLWKNGYVLGFVSKAKVESLLRQQPPGTFLLRFSDSKIGGVSISYLKIGAPKVESLQPFTKDDLSRRGMIDLFFDLDNLLQLYPSTAGGGNIPKVMLNQLRQKNEERNHFTKNEILNLGSYKYIL